MKRCSLRLQSLQSASFGKKALGLEVNTAPTDTREAKAQHAGMQTSLNMHTWKRRRTASRV